MRKSLVQSVVLLALGFTVQANAQEARRLGAVTSQNQICGSIESVTYNSQENLGIKSPTSELELGCGIFDLCNAGTTAKLWIKTSSGSHALIIRDIVQTYEHELALAKQLGRKFDRRVGSGDILLKMALDGKRSKSHVCADVQTHAIQVQKTPDRGWVRTPKYENSGESIAFATSISLANEVSGL